MSRPPEDLPAPRLDALLERAKRRGRQRRARRRAALGGAVGLVVLLACAVALSMTGGRGPTNVHVVGPAPNSTSPSPTSTSVPSSNTPSPGLSTSPASGGVPGLAPGDPGALAVGPNGNLYIADNARNQVLERLQDASFVVVAGNGTGGFSGDGGPATKAELNGPEGMAFGADGTLYVADTQNDRVRAITPTGTITTVAGGGGSGACPLLPTGTRAIGAAVGQPADVAFGPDGRLYIAAPCNNEILRVNPDGTLTEIAGNSRYRGSYGIGLPATQASPDGPQALGFDKAGNLYLFGFNDKSLLMINTAGVMTAPAGTQNFFPKGHGGIAERADGTVIAMNLQTVVALSPSGTRALVDFGAIGPGAVGGIRNFLPGGLAVAPDGTIYTDTNPDFASAIQSAIVTIPPGGSPRVIWGPAGPGSALASPSPSPSRGTGSIVLGPDGLGLVNDGEIQTATVDAVTAVLGAPTDTQPGVCPGTTEVEWNDLSLEFSGGKLQGYRYNRGGFGALGSVTPPAGSAVPILRTAVGATLGLTLAQAEHLYPPADFSMSQGGSIVVPGSTGSLFLGFFASSPATPLSEIKGGQPCGDV